jgi:hypothetical protein
MHRVLRPKRAAGSHTSQIKSGRHEEVQHVGRTHKIKQHRVAMQARCYLIDGWLSPLAQARLLWAGNLAQGLRVVYSKPVTVGDTVAQMSQQLQLRSTIEIMVH